MPQLEDRFQRLLADLAAAAAGRAVALLAVSKTQPAAAVRALAALGQRGFGENYVQEALAKQRELEDLALDWHLIGPLQSNKCREAATQFDWVHSVDREKLVPLLARFRPAERAPLNVLVQVNIDDEASKSGCAPAAAMALADAIAAQPSLRLRGLMAIPRPTEDLAQRRDAFRRMRVLFDAMRERHPDIDTLSMGMSDDYALAIAEGANLVRIGSALFGPRSSKR
ncbi:MAG TPA: YggS family pyridoxal phosphate-dependent enzyme [Patescibacteria group bacterium]|nr:YggS family pyridoxal phosphate-dependent enzyme [Patescibacteria group bacterium]